MWWGAQMSCDTPVVFLLPATLFPRSLQDASCQLQAQVILPVLRGPLTPPPHLGSGHSDHIPSRLSSPCETAVFWIMVCLPHWNACPPKSGNSPDWFLASSLGPEQGLAHGSCTKALTGLRNKWVWSGSPGVSSWALCQGLPVWLSVERLVPGTGMLLARPHWG